MQTFLYGLRVHLFSKPYTVSTWLVALKSGAGTIKPSSRK